MKTAILLRASIYFLSGMFSLTRTGVRFGIEKLLSQASLLEKFFLMLSFFFLCPDFQFLSYHSLYSFHFPVKGISFEKVVVYYLGFEVSGLRPVVLECFQGPIL